MFLEEIVNCASLENDTFECKALLDRKNVIGWIKTIAGFANSKGGTFFIGVEDKTNKLIGFDRIGADNERNYFNNQINQHVYPVPNISIRFIRYEINDNERFIIKVDIPEAEFKPVIVKYNGLPSIFMRRSGFTNGATYEEIIQMSEKASKKAFDGIYTNVKYDRKNFSKLIDFYMRHNDGKELSDKFLMSLGFFDENYNLANGAMLFMDNYDGEKTCIKFSVFAGFNKGSDRIVTLDSINKNIVDSIEYAVEFISQRMNHSIIKYDNGRINIDSYPPRALFEGIINSIANRDYYIDGSQIQIDMFKDRLEISSPGSFYRGEKISKRYDLNKIISQRRNNLISSVLVGCNVMEASGTGFNKITNAYKDYDDKHCPFIFSTYDHFTLVLPDLTYENGIENNSSLIYIPIKSESKYDYDILEYCYNMARKASEIADYLGVSNSTFLRKSILENLTVQGYLFKSKVGNAVYYRTNIELVK